MLPISKNVGSRTNIYKLEVEEPSRINLFGFMDNSLNGANHIKQKQFKFTVCTSSGSLYQNGSFRSSSVTKLFNELFLKKNFWGADQTKITSPIYSATILNNNWDSFNWKIRGTDI